MPHLVENRGRHPKITPEVHRKILDGVKSNLPYKFCAWDAGITERTIYNWLKRGELESDDGLVTEFTLFFHSIKEAEAQKVRDHLSAIENCCERWQARMTILERRWRDDFAQDSAQLSEIKEIFKFFKDKENDKQPSNEQNGPGQV